MALRPASLEERTKQVRQAALNYCGTADTNLKRQLLQAEKRLNQAKQHFLHLEEETSKLTTKYSMKRLSKIMDIANAIVDQKTVTMDDLKVTEVEDMRTYYIPYLQQKKVIEMRMKEFELIQQKIEINADVYMLYKGELDNASVE